MRKRTDVIYVYDGTFNGFLCCVYEYYYSSFNPVEIFCEDDAEASLYDMITIASDPFKAQKVAAAIKEKMSPYALRFLSESFLSNENGRERHMLGYIVKGFKLGEEIYRYISDEDVCFVRKIHRNVKREQHLYLGIARFYKAGEVYVSVIKPNNRILPLISRHFSQRFPNDSFMIYDAANKEALMYNTKQSVIVQAEHIELPEVDENEKDMQRLWKLFYDTVEIKERHNPRCRMNFMPKRTWDMLPEMQEQ